MEKSVRAGSRCGQIYRVYTVLVCCSIMSPWLFPALLLLLLILSASPERHEPLLLLSKSACSWALHCSVFETRVLSHDHRRTVVCHRQPGHPVYYTPSGYTLHAHASIRDDIFRSKVLPRIPGAVQQLASPNCAHEQQQR